MVPDKADQVIDRFEELIKGWTLSFQNGQINENYFTNASTLLVKIILCCKCHDLTV